MLSVFVGSWLLWHFAQRQKRHAWPQPGPAVLAASLVLIPGGLAMATYFKAITGSPPTIPYAGKSKVVRLADDHGMD